MLGQNRPFHYLISPPNFLQVLLAEVMLPNIAFLEANLPVFVELLTDPLFSALILVVPLSTAPLLAVPLFEVHLLAYRLLDDPLPFVVSQLQAPRLEASRLMAPRLLDQWQLAQLLKVLPFAVLILAAPLITITSPLIADPQLLVQL